MAIPDRDTVYTTEPANRTNVYTRESSSTGWFVGIIVALALLAIGYLVFSANSGPSSTTVDVNNTPAVTAPATDAPAMAPAETPAPATEVTPMTEAPAPATEAPVAPATEAAPAVEAAPVVEPAPADGTTTTN